MKSSIPKRTDDYALDYMGLKLCHATLAELKSRATADYVLGQRSAYAVNVAVTIDLLVSLGYLRTEPGADGTLILIKP